MITLSIWINVLTWKYEIIFEWRDTIVMLKCDGLDSSCNDTRKNMYINVKIKISRSYVFGQQVGKNYFTYDNDFY